MNHQSSPGPPASIPERMVDLKHEINKADLILVADVSKVRDASEPVSLVNPRAQPAHDHLRVAELAVIRILAGKLKAGPLHVYFLTGKNPSRQWKPLLAGQTLLLFLRSVPGGYVRVTPTRRPIQTLSGISLALAGASRARAVAHELEQIVLLADADTETHLIIEGCTARTTLQGDVDILQLGTPALRNPIRRAAWIAIALADGKAEALDDVESLVLDPPPLAGEALWRLAVQKVSELTIPAARHQLTMLLQSPAVVLVRAAAEALRHLYDRATIPALVRMLNHPDQEARYHALMGLAELEPDVGEAPSFERFRADEAPFIERWKQWWERRDRAD